jgi:hypothetical protein
LGRDGGKRPGGEDSHDTGAHKPENLLHEILRDKDVDNNRLDALGELKSGHSKQNPSGIASICAIRGFCGQISDVTKRALITGITGQVGSYLAEYLLGLGYEVYGLIRRGSPGNTGT